MDRRKYLRKGIRIGRVIGMEESGLSQREISRRLGFDRKTVATWLRKWEEEGEDLSDGRKGGNRPRGTTAEEDQQIVQTSEANPHMNAQEIKELLNLQVSVETVRRRLHRAGIHHRTPAVKEYLTPRHKELRLQFAQQYQERGLDFWGRVIFSDEKTFSSATHGRLHCWRRDGTRYDEVNICSAARSGHVTCNTWGWLHLFGVGELARIEGRFTADQYLEILEEVMLPTVRAMALPYPEKIIFMQDNSPVHTASIVKRWFAEQHDVELLPWPSRGCDLNPIEHVWANIVNCWEQERERRPDDLWEHAVREWTMLRKKPDMIYNLVSSVPDRLRSVITHQGGWTAY